MDSVWVFNGEGCALPSGVFRERGAAEAWIRVNKLTGTLSELPLDMGAYDHALAKGLFAPKNEKERSPGFKADFSPRMPHFHWTDGEPDRD